ncbi:MAG TPA: FecR domain-containing protein [Chitinophagaceae bacterium]|nr:FecR domain-containing protein [Chitinophagaceae bacterium]HQZ78787.1 FecR domain-containing protein [Bacteroidia bacterium]MBP7109233.1 FecR domain-containing protein [Chitinophagaceae bacterium]MBP7315273.1 FecR domain-containing protein [Chitinophagaceae bacterium]HQV55628.1 FecR domain-containing protein [Chitinophagaceae bacterium]
MNQQNEAFQQSQFILKHLRGELSMAEKNELDAWLGSNDNNRILFEELTNEVLLKKELQFFDSIETETAWQKIAAQGKKPATIVPIKTNRRWWYAAAAVLLLGGFLTYRLAFQQPDKTPIVKTTPEKNDVAPGGNKAILTLADGSTIILDNAANGNLAEQGNTKVIKLDDGQLAYNAGGIGSEVVYNTISTPRGGQYQLTLADGTKVWLNAASTLRFPATFSGTERKVELTGEGYFEVAKNAAMPFKIDVAGKGEVEVLGTHFNINSYNNEPAINTTLIEGSVKVTGLTLGKTVVLMPGQQTQLSGTGDISINRNPDIESVLAWKNEKFVFQNTDLKSIMRQLERWYDISVSYEGNGYTDEYVGIISRNVNISQILKMLEKTSEARFQINGKNIIVK